MTITNEHHRVIVARLDDLSDELGDAITGLERGASWSEFVAELEMALQHWKEWLDENRTYLPAEQALDVHIDGCTERLRAA